MRLDESALQAPTRSDASAEETFLSPRGLARLLLVETSTLAAWRRRGIGPRWYRLHDHLIRYDRADVLKWIQTQAATNVTEQPADFEGAAR